ESQVKPSAAAVPGDWSARPPSGPRYQDRPSVPGIGKLEKDCSNAGYGHPGFDALPAPLSKRTRTWGSASDAVCAPLRGGCVWIGSAGRLASGGDPPGPSIPQIACIAIGQLP